MSVFRLARKSSVHAQPDAIDRTIPLAKSEKSKTDRPARDLGHARVLSRGPTVINISYTFQAQPNRELQAPYYSKFDVVALKTGSNSTLAARYKHGAGTLNRKHKTVFLLLGITVAGMCTLLTASAVEPSFSEKAMSPYTDLPKEKFAHAVISVDRALSLDRPNTVDVTDAFLGVLPSSREIKDHLEFFAAIGSSAKHAYINHKYFVYFSFSRKQLAQFGGKRFRWGDELVVRYITTDLSDEATILEITIVVLNGSGS